MILAVIILAAGILLAAASILLRGRLGRGWMASLLAAGVLLAGCGGWLTHGQLSQGQQTRESLFLALQYLARGESDSASFYLKKAGAAEDFPAAALRFLLEQVRGNSLNARLNYDSALSMANEEEEELLRFLDQVDTQDLQQLSLAADRLAGLLDLSPEREETLSLFVLAESQGAAWDSETMEDAGLDATALARLRVSNLLSQGSFESAVTAATALVDEDPSADNRLLLAEAVAESAYQNVLLSSRSFQPGWEELSSLTGMEFSQPEGSAEEERQELDARRQELESQLAALEITLSAAGEEELSQLNEEKLALTEEIAQLQRRSDKLFVYRAFNSIADLHSLEAQLVRARLYFALQDHDSAVETLLDSAGSLQAKLTADRTLANNLRIVAQAYDSQTESLLGQEFQDAMTQLLSAPFSDLLYISQTQLTQDFVQRIVSDQKTYGQSLFLSRLDTSAFPQVQATLSGREEVLEQIARQEGTTVRDTRQDVTYTAHLEEGALANVCVVVDRSGSMNGSPMQDLKEALADFVRDASADTPISLAAFESGAELLSELTTDKAALLSAVEGLSASGGTDISAGIRVGLQALEPAAGSRVMLLMTDGQSSFDSSAVDEAAAMGITIHTIGFGSANDTLLEQIASATGGQYVRADSSTELRNIYASLQQIIGHVITVEYTAPSAQEGQGRYFFLRTGDNSVRVPYSLEEEGTPVRLYSASPALVSPEQLARYTEQGSTLSLTLEGEGLLEVAGVTVGGQAAQINRQEEAYLQLSVPPGLAQGWQAVSLTLQDGSTLTFDQLLLVAPSATYRNLRLGSLVIPYASGALPGDGTLVLAGSGIQVEENRSAEGSSLSLSVEGTLILPWNQPAPPEGEAAPTQDIDLGDQGTITGWGLVALRGADSAYDNRAPSQVAAGALRIECAPDQSRLIQIEEG